MLIDILSDLFKRDLEKLIREIGLYKNEKVIWDIDGHIANSARNLTLHLVGNLNTYIGSVIGKTSYVRNREQEFSLKDVPRHDLIQKLNDTMEVVEHSLEKMTSGQLTEEYPVQVFEKKTSTEYMLVHLATHLSYHLGQVNYHRRFLDK
jgi:hypothetical protein